MVRLVVRLQTEQLPRYLRAIGWPGGPAALRAWLQGPAREMPSLSVNLDIGPDAVGPRLGIEHHMLPGQPTAREWPRLLDRLAALGACHPRQAEHILAWLHGAASSAGPLRVRRDLMVKVIFGAGAPRAKAYLQFLPTITGAAWMATQPSGFATPAPRSDASASRRSAAPASPPRSSPRRTRVAAASRLRIGG